MNCYPRFYAAKGSEVLFHNNIKMLKQLAREQFGSLRGVVFFVKFDACSDWKQVPLPR